jgi:hypothetical protein
MKLYKRQTEIIEDENRGRSSTAMFDRTLAIGNLRHARHGFLEFLV